jgi:uncharacterized cupredoxin-like copper-binding protein/Cu/Ag efflux protein CusF
MKSPGFILSAAALMVGMHAHAAQHAAHVASAPAAGHSHDHSAAIGAAGDRAKVNRTVSVDMTDNMRFTPDSVAVKQGETIRFVVKNSGKLKHEFVLGTEHALHEHDELMKKFPEMEHSDPNQVTVQPGQTGEVVWRFTKSGQVAFGCLQPGHYDAGMKGVVKVAAGGAPTSTATTAATTTTKADAAGADRKGDAAAAAAPGPASMTDGEVKKIDKENQKLTLKHGEIANLAMPGMTMVFKVKDPSVLDRLQAGDKVRFAAEKAGGSLVVTQIEVLK